ncbi:MAG TPA: DUF1573 domain-containing protein [Spirochaetota bacterium]|nr:DUF1573 domain-containing protein [Spirochaetota bacterium]HPS88335.1 DUF1573 domain-containing protein [Spirochaetota bacterium]
MKKYLFCILLIVLLPVIFCEAKSVIVFEETSYNFGKVNKEAVLKHTFIFKNTGKDTLVIERVRASCSCTGTLLSEREIPSGESGKLEIELNTETNLGEMMRTIRVYTNDPNNKLIKIVVKATVIEN